MARRIALDIPGVRLNETSHAALALIARKARERSGLACKPVPISRRQFGEELGMSGSNSIRTCRMLEDGGLIVAHDCTHEDGSQSANSYCLTALGIEVLRLADEAVAAGRVGVS